MVNKLYFLPLVVASLGLFSSVSSSTGYFSQRAEVQSSLMCQPDDAETFERLLYTESGVANFFSTESAAVSCPLSRRASARGRYSVAITVFNPFGGASGINCSLLETKSNGEFAQILSRFTEVPAGFDGQIVRWDNVRILDGRFSSLVLSCFLPPGYALGNIVIDSRRR